MNSTTPSYVYTTNDVPLAARVTPHMLHTLDFIHRFRHVTVRHVQLALRHAAITTTHNQLKLMSAKGYMDRRSGSSDREAERPVSSYFLTLEGLALLKTRKPEGKYRQKRSVIADATVSESSMERYHALVDVYAHFKRHYDGHFEFFARHDLAGLDLIPDEVPDGYVRVTLPGVDTQHYFVEICGWGRSPQLQRRRLCSYLQFAESAYWEQLPAKLRPQLFLVAPGKAARYHLDVQMRQLLEESLVTDLKVYSAVATRLDSEESAIWRNIEY